MVLPMAVSTQKHALIQFGFDFLERQSTKFVPLGVFLSRISVMKMQRARTLGIATLLAFPAFIGESLHLAMSVTIGTSFGVALPTQRTGVPVPSTKELLDRSLPTVATSSVESPWFRTPSLNLHTHVPHTAGHGGLGDPNLLDYLAKK